MNLCDVAWRGTGNYVPFLLYSIIFPPNKAMKTVKRWLYSLHLFCLSESSFMCVWPSTKPRLINALPDAMSSYNAQKRTSSCQTYYEANAFVLNFFSWWCFPWVFVCLQFPPGERWKFLARSTEKAVVSSLPKQNLCRCRTKVPPQNSSIISNDISRYQIVADLRGLFSTFFSQISDHSANKLRPISLVYRWNTKQAN